jgi:hypothetical protein
MVSDISSTMFVADRIVAYWHGFPFNQLVTRPRYPRSRNATTAGTPEGMLGVEI